MIDFHSCSETSRRFLVLFDQAELSLDFQTKPGLLIGFSGNIIFVPSSVQ